MDGNDMKNTRFSKQLLAEVLDKKVSDIKIRHGFKTGTGTYQICQHPTKETLEFMNRCIDYGKMIAYIDLAKSADDSFALDLEIIDYRILAERVK